MPKIANIIQKYRKIYQDINPTFSPAIGTTVYFNMKGFKHLIFKGRRRRDNKTIYNRLVLIPLITQVIEKCEEVGEIRKRKERTKKSVKEVTYVALEYYITNDTKIRVIVRRDKKNGRFYFQSIMKCK